MTHGRIAATALLALLATVAPAAATDGPIYIQGPSANFVVGGQVTVTEPQPQVWQINYPAVVAQAGTKWEMNWSCPPGTQAEWVAWSSLRYASESAFHAAVIGNGGQLIAAIPDVQMPRSPSPGQNYSIAMPPGHCSAGLSMRQSQSVAQHARVYWVGGPRAAFRDVTPPSVGIRQLPTGWLNAGASGFRVDWSANDNMGADGVLQHTVTVAGIGRWTGSPGVGDFAADVSINGLPDGTHPVQVIVAGDGTAAGVAPGVVNIDRAPPLASIPFASATGDAGTANVSWTVSDTTSGLADSVVEINTAPDGSTSGTWVPVTSPSSQAGDRTQLAVSLSGVPDGAHATRVRATDRAGNIGYSELGEIVVDRTPPTVALAALPTAPIRTVQLAVTLDDNLAGRIGLGATTVQVNSAPDGSASGTWHQLVGPLLLPRGTHEISVDLSIVGDGPRLLRVVTANGGAYGERISGSASGIVTVDATSPNLTEVTIGPTGDGRVSARWIARDSRSGVATARIDWQDGSVWRPITTVPAGDGAGEMTADLRQVPNGVQRFRLVVTDRAGNESAVTGPSEGIRVDNTPPTVTALRLGGPLWTISWRTSVAAAGSCDTVVAVNGPGTGAAWRDVVSVRTQMGDQSIAIPTAGLAPSLYRVRVTVCDAAGTTATGEIGGLEVVGPAGTTGSNAALADARVTALAVQGRSSKRGRRIVTALTYGSRIRVTGRLLGATKAPLGRVPLEVLDARGTPVGRTTTAANGRFSVRVRPGRSGALRFAVVSSSGPIAVTATMRIVTRVTPLVTLQASTRTVTAGGESVVFRGQIAPTAQQLGLNEEKSIVLEWGDPVRGVWRPVLNDSAQPDGTFQVEYQFQARGQRFPVRVRVPKELGWSFEEGVSRSIGIRVR